MKETEFILTEETQRLLRARVLFTETVNELSEAIMCIYGDDVFDTIFEKFYNEFASPFGDEIERLLTERIFDRLMERDIFWQKEIAL